MVSLAAKDVYCGVPNTTRGEVTHISVDPSGQTDLIAFPCGRVAVVRSATFPLKCSVYTQHANPVTCVRFSPDGKRVASGDECGVVRIWDRETHSNSMDEQVMSGPVRDIAFSDDQAFMLVTGEARGAYAKAIKIPSGANAGVCSGQTKRVIACDISPSKPSRAATGSEDMTVGVFKGPPIRDIDVPVFARHHKGFVNDLKYSPDGKVLAVASSDRTISILDANSGEVIRTLEGHSGSVTGVSWASDSRTLLSSSNDKTQALWNAEDGQCMATVEFGSDVMDMQVGCALCSATNSQISVSLRGDINVVPHKGSSQERVLRGHSKQVVGIAVVGSKAYSADYSGAMVAWDIGVGCSDVFFNGKGPSTSLCAVAGNSSIVSCVGQDGKIFVTPTSSLTFQKPVTIKGGGVDVAVPTSCNKSVSTVVINESRLVALDATGNNVAAEFVFRGGETGASVSVNSDATLVAVGVQISGGSGELRFAALKNGSFVFAGEVIRLQSVPNRICFSPDNTLIAIGESARYVRIYDVATRKKVIGGGIAHTARVDAIAFNQKSNRVASGGMDGSIAIWSVKSEDEPCRMTAAHRGGVTGLGFSDANTLVSSGSDSCLRSWSVPN